MQHTAILPSGAFSAPLPIIGLKIPEPPRSLLTPYGAPILPRFVVEGDLTRDGIGLAIEALLVALDAADGDPDLEPGGDDEPVRANGDTEDVSWHEEASMRGCGLQNTCFEDDEAYGDELGDNTGAEDEGPGLATNRSGPGCAISDAPEDGGDTEPNGDEGDHNSAEDDFCVHAASGPGCPIADPDYSIEPYA